jgi:hypothetical protein
MALRSMMNEKVTLRKKTGATHDFKALVQPTKIFTDDVQLPVEEGDVVERKLPNGMTETFVVMERGFMAGMHAIPDHYQMEVRKGETFPSGSRPQHQTGLTTHIYNSGGINITGGNVMALGDMVGRDKIVGTQVSTARLEEVFRPVMEAINSAPVEQRGEAIQELRTLHTEAAKGKGADDGKMAELIDGLIGLVPSAVSALASAFAQPILAAVAGPATQMVLDKIQGKKKSG